MRTNQARPLARRQESGRLAAHQRILALGAVLATTFMVRHEVAAAANVTWSLGDSVAACPAGDTLSTSVTRPARLRIAVQYLNASGNPRVGVPPESGDQRRNGRVVVAR